MRSTNIPDNAEPIVSINKDKEQGSNSFYFMWKTEAYPRELKNTAAYLMTSLITYSIEKMFDERISEILQKENPPFLGAGFGYENFFVSKTKEAFSAAVTCEENKYEQGIKALYREILRVKRHGFTEVEFDRFKSEYKSQIENLYLHRDKIESSQYVNDCVRNFCGFKHFLPYVTFKLNVAVLSDNVLPYRQAFEAIYTPLPLF